MSGTSNGVKALIAIGAVALLVVGLAVPLSTFGAVIAGGSLMSAGTSALSVLVQDDETKANACVQPSAGGSYSATTASQTEYVRSIIGVAKDLGVSTDGQTIALMVMLAESEGQNFANDGTNVFNFNIGTAQGTQFWLDVAKHSLELPHDRVSNDADSVGLFQQRASAGWADTEEDGFKAADDPAGAINRLMNPEFAARAFFGGPGGVSNRGLLDISGWEEMELGVAAQTVQVSDRPNAYKKREREARQLVEANADAPPISASDSTTATVADDTAAADSGDTAAPASGQLSYDDFMIPVDEGIPVTSEYGTRTHPTTGEVKKHKGIDYGGPLGSPIYATAPGSVVGAGEKSGFGYWVVIDHEVEGKTVSSVYGHMPGDSITVAIGDKVTAGQQIAEIGSEGRSTGAHLHFEIWPGGRLSGGTDIDPAPVLKGGYSNIQAFAGGSAQGSSAAVDLCTTSSATAGTTVAVDGAAGPIIAAGQDMVDQVIPYVWGDGELTGPGSGGGFDCSGLMRYMIYTGSGYELPRTSRQQYTATSGNVVMKPGGDPSTLQAGDLLFWGNSAGTIHHVAMYIGNGKIMEASSSRGQMNVSSMEGRFGGDFFAATRIDYGTGE